MASFMFKDVRTFTGKDVLQSGNVLFEEGIIKYVGNDVPDTEVRSVSGSDATGPAPGTAWRLVLHQELYLFVHEAGSSPQEAVRAATTLKAKRFRLNGRGLIAPPHKADLVLIESNLLKTIRDALGITGLVGLWLVGRLEYLISHSSFQS